MPLHSINNQQQQKTEIDFTNENHIKHVAARNNGVSSHLNKFMPSASFYLCQIGHGKLKMVFHLIFCSIKCKPTSTGTHTHTPKWILLSILSVRFTLSMMKSYNIWWYGIVLLYFRHAIENNINILRANRLYSTLYNIYISSTIHE